MRATMTRREFVRTGVVVAALVAGGGTSACADGRDGRPAATPSMRYGGDSKMDERVLVGYATRTGSTAGVAEAIGKALAARGFRVDVRPLRERPPVDGYDAVVLGSAINGAAWVPEAMGFLETNATTLRKRPTAVFCVHAMNTADTDKARLKRRAYLDKVREVVRPVDEGFFAGVGPSAKDTSLIARWAFKAFGGDIEGDARDWTKIERWAERLQLTPASQAEGRG